MIDIPHVPEPHESEIVMDENTGLSDNERLPIHGPLKLLRYRTIKKNNSLGWWSCIVLLEDHGNKQVCFYRWHKKDGDWKRDKKLTFKNRSDWTTIKTTIDDFINGLD